MYILVLSIYEEFIKNDGKNKLIDYIENLVFNFRVMHIDVLQFVVIMRPIVYNEYRTV